MTIDFIAAGKPGTTWAVSALEHYTTFLSKYARVNCHFVRAAGKTAANPSLAAKAEAERMLKLAANLNGFRIACDSSGRAYDSPQFARTWRQEMDRHGGHAILVIGGAWGLDPTVLKWAHLVWSLGPMTFPHEMALIVSMEQIARACSINRGESYHK